MIAFDIETTGLSPQTCEVTCICACDPESGVEMTVIPPLGQSAEPFFELMDSADRVCAFNGARFDIPFLQERYGLSDARVGRWMLKLVDLYEAAFQAFGRAFPLNRLLAANGFESKIDSGANAIALAHARDWARLSAYCMDDARKTHAVSSLGRIVLPLRGYSNAFRVGWRFSAG